MSAATTRQILRCAAQRLALASGRTATGPRAASTLTQQRQRVEGANGEQIIVSPKSDPPFCNLLTHEYVWNEAASVRDSVALECGVSGRKYTYSQARDAANYVARSLANLGLRKGDVVALIAPNYPETILAFLAALEADLVVTPVNPFCTIDEISRQLKSSGAKAVITAAEVASAASQAARATLSADVALVVIEDGVKPRPDGSIPFKDLIDRGRSLPDVRSRNTGDQELAVLPYSSGTTGLPKGVMLSHRNLVSNMEMCYHTFPDLFLPTADIHQDVVPIVLPFFHIFGMNGLSLPRLSKGAKLVTLPRFTPDSFANMLNNHRVTTLYCVPPIILFLAMSPAITRDHLASLSLILSGAAPISATDVQRFYEKFQLNDSTLKFFQGYGLTEAAPVCFLELSGKKHSSIGKTVAGSEARLVDCMTNEDVCSPGQTGELWVRGRHVMQGYYKNEEATKETIVGDGWLKTGDIAYYDDDHDFFITDRLKELIKVKGYQVPPAELEALLRTHPEVHEAAVIGIPDERYGEVPKAFVVAKKDSSRNPEAIVNFLKGQVSEYKELRGGVTFVDSIPKNASGKILRSQLKAEYLEKH